MADTPLPPTPTPTPASRQASTSGHQARSSDPRDPCCRGPRRSSSPRVPCPWRHTPRYSAWPWRTCTRRSPSRCSARVLRTKPNAQRPRLSLPFLSRFHTRTHKHKPPPSTRTHGHMYTRAHGHTDTDTPTHPQTNTRPHARTKTRGYVYANDNVAELPGGNSPPAVGSCVRVRRHAYTTPTGRRHHPNGAKRTRPPIRRTRKWDNPTNATRCRSRYGLCLHFIPA